MIRSIRPHVVGLLALMLSLLGSGSAAAWPLEATVAGPSSAVVSGSGPTHAMRFGSVTIDQPLPGAGSREARWLRRLTWRRAASRRHGRQLLGAGASALSPGRNPVVLAFKRDGGENDGRGVRTPAWMAGRIAGPSRAPPALN